MTKPLKKLIDAIGPKPAGERHRQALGGLDDEARKLAEAIATAEAEVETLTEAGEDASAPAGRVVELNGKRSALEIRRRPLLALIEKADAAERARLEAERRTRMEAALEKKRARALVLRAAAVSGLAEGLSALSRLDTLEKEAGRLADTLGVHALELDCSSDAVALDAVALAGLGDGDPYTVYTVISLSFPRAVAPAEEPSS